MTIVLPWLIGALVIFQVVNSTTAQEPSNDDELTKIRDTMNHMSRQMMLQQLFVEEKIRSEGNSGIKLTRLTRTGTKSYYSTHYSGRQVGAIHDHADHVRTVGMGELIAVLNGVEFRTRHNDYKLVTPLAVTSNNTIDYNKVEEIPFPDVPPSVKGTVDEQIAEMREYVKAFAEQNETRRDYKNYFKPLMCYLEGGWTNSAEGTIDESFSSDRHQLDADSWLELQEKVRYSSYTGRKDRLENFAYLPTTIMKVVNGVPILAQWNYRIVCHPLNKDLSTKRLLLVDDLEIRMAERKSLDDYEDSRSARFRLAPKDNDGWKEGIYRQILLDDIMNEIPGKNGYGNVLYDDGVGDSRAMNIVDPTKPLNAGYYHRWFTGDRDAMGATFQKRGFSDDSLFMAATTHEKIAPSEARFCRKRKCNESKGRNCSCNDVYQRYTYAIPLEIIYMTPLQRWNPHNIAYEHDVSPKVGGANGKTEAKALGHTSKDTYSRLPLEFFKDNKNTGDAADTSNGYYWVKGRDGKTHKVVASGLRVKLPKIEGIDKQIRLRYPIFPIHQAGSVVWKRLEALEQLVRRFSSHCSYVDNNC